MSRYINSADVLHTLKSLLYETALNQDDLRYAEVFEDIAKNRVETWVDLIPTADVVEAPRWIPVTERLPEKHSSAIVTDLGYVTFAYTNNLDEWMDYDGNRLKNVTAWMPLPEPYREEADNDDANGG